jgi:hypothetical protein
MVNLFKKFILWLKKIFHIYSEPKDGERESLDETSSHKEFVEGTQIVEIEPKKSPSTLKEGQVKVKASEEMATKVPVPVKEAPQEASKKTEPLEEMQEESISHKPIEDLEKIESEKNEVRPKQRKPYKKKVPTEERTKIDRKPSENKDSPSSKQERKEIDLGSIRRRRQRQTKLPQQPKEISPDEPNSKTTEKKESPVRVESPL